MPSQRVAFIDRDGTIIKEPEDFQIDRLDKIRLVDGVIPALLTLQELGYQLVMVSNQDGLGTESFPQADFDLTHNFVMNLLVSQGIHFERVAICPHLESDACGCRKPRIGLVLPEIRRGDLDFSLSFVVGDRPSDVQMAKNLGIKSYQLGPLQWTDIIKDLKSLGRTATVERKTKETRIKIQVDLDGRGESTIATGHGFFDHMLEQISRHSGMDLNVQCQGDLHIDDHHTVEDVALTLGEALRKALGDKKGMERYGFVLPMDETKVEVTIDLSNRPYFVFDGKFSRPEVGGLSTEMVIHFFRSLSEALRANLHIKVKGENTHHMVEACFKGFARAFRQAIKVTEGQGLPSTKGSL